MLVRDYTLPQLVDLALRVPEIGAVNFNILHTVLQSIIVEMNLNVVKPWCHIDNPVVARAALTRAKLVAPPMRRSYSAETELHPASSSRPITPSQLGPLRAGETEGTTEEQEVEHDADERLEEGGDLEQEDEIAEAGSDVEDEEEELADDEEEGIYEEEDETAQSSAEKKRKKVERMRLPSFGEDVLEKIEQGKQSEMMTEMWRATNVNRRLEAAEEGLEKLSFIVDRLADRMTDMTDNTTDTQVAVDTLKPQVTTLVDEIETIKEIATPKEEFQEVKTRTDIIEEVKTDKDDVLRLIEEKLAAGQDEDYGAIKQKVEDLEETVQFILHFLGLSFVPTSQRGEEEEEQETPVTLNDRLDEIWNEMEKVMSKVKFGGSEIDSQKLDDQERLMKSLADNVENIRAKVEMFESEAKRKEKVFEVLQNDVSDLQFTKADKDVVVNSLGTKADKKDLDKKVDRDEFVATVEDLGESIEGLVEKFKSNEEEWRSAVTIINEELKLKLSTADYHTLQEPVQNRIRALLYGFQKMKSIILSALYPDAAGVTKCVSCGRPAQLAGSKFKPSGDYEGPSVQPTPNASSPSKTQSLNDLPPSDPSDSEGTKSYMSLPESALRQKPGTDVSKQSTTTLQTDTDIGLCKQKTRKSMNNEFEKLTATSPRTRFCGGKHTLTAPLQKGIKFVDSEIPPVYKENVSLVSYDKALWYKGAVPSGLGGELDEETVSIDDIMESCYELYPELPPRDTSSPRYCGGAHTLTAPLQRGTPFTPLRIAESPLPESTLYVPGRGVYKGKAVSDDLVDAENVVDSPSMSEATTGQEQKSRQILHPNIVSLPYETESAHIFSLKKQIISLKVPKDELSRIKPNNLFGKRPYNMPPSSSSTTEQDSDETPSTQK